jgi:hypothetical protein
MVSKKEAPDRLVTCRGKETVEEEGDHGLTTNRRRNLNEKARDSRGLRENSPNLGRLDYKCPV